MPRRPPDNSAMPKSPVMVARGWSDAQKRAYVIADNQLALNAGWDERREAGVVTKYAAQI